MSRSEIRERIDALTEAIETCTDKAEADEMRQKRAALHRKVTVALNGGRAPADPDTRFVKPSPDSDIDAWLRADDGAIGKSERTFRLPDTETEVRELAAQYERRDNTTAQTVSITGGSAGGFTVPPGFWQNLQITLRDYGGLWNSFRLVRTDNGAPMSWPTNSPTAVVASLLTEDTQLLPSSAYTFGLGQMFAWTVVGPLTLVTFQLEEDSAFDTGEFVGARLGEAIDRELAALAWSGTGASQPLGLTTALAAGTSIARRLDDRACSQHHRPDDCPADDRGD